MRPSLTAMSIASPLECSTEAACTHRSTSSSLSPASRARSTRTGQGSPGPYGVRSPHGSVMRSVMLGPYPAEAVQSRKIRERFAAFVAELEAADLEEVGAGADADEALVTV